MSETATAPRVQYFGGTRRAQAIVRNRLKQIRTSSGATLREVAEATGINKDTLGAIERCEQNAHDADKQRLVAYFRARTGSARLGILDLFFVE